MPYNADPYRGDRYLFEGIASAGRGVSRGLEQAFAKMEEKKEQQKEEEKRLSSLGSMADSFAKATPQFLDSVGLTPESWKNIGAREKASAMDGWIQSKTVEQLAQRIASQRQGMEQETALGTALGRYAQGPQPPLAAAAGPDSELKRRNFALSTPNLGGSGSMRLLEGLSRMAPKETGWNLQPGQVMEGPGGRKLVPVSPNSFQVVEDNEQGPEADPVPGWVFSDDDAEFQRGMKNITDAPQAKVLNALRAGYLRGSGKEMDFTQQLLNRALGGAAPTEAAPAAAPKLTPPSAPAAPRLGEVRGGYEYVGPNPADRRSWRKVPSAE